MGLRGTDVARDAADMVLTDDAFATIVAAVREGRVIFDNIRAFVIYLLSCNLSEVLVIGLAATLGYPLPLLPLQILFINLVTDVLPALALGNGEGDGNVMKRPPRAHDEPLLARAHWRTVVGYAVLLTASVLAAFVYALEVMGLSEGQAVTVSFSALALAQVWHVFTMREPGTGLLHNTITRNRLVWLATAVCSAAIVLVNALPPLRSILHLEPLPADGWVLIAVAVAVPAVLGQIGKALGLGKVA
jgi:Ca2+-transporting ATPase